MTSPIVSNLTVDELKDVIASFVEEYEEKVSDARSQLKQVENLLGSLPHVSQDNPWLKMAGMHQDNPLFEEVAASIEANHQDITDEELS
ncbi:hypothetical protein VB774_13000 [Pseudanabaena galeata UHCC 0370]|uniref:Uncharacterized protein n=1 Tax=Pseudanabaena galeata UHCC 0370 TaxID=3110310 RepID=A0ABU5TJW3_9CYAN|nr:hypothetical protein [Pseudanabaena galeata]MEA5478539.1 hypothetical protein [Pseudanabaena galeata UHCC 0370]